MIRYRRHFFWLLITPALLTGFRFFPDGNQWNISAETATSAKIYVIFEHGSDTMMNDVGSDDSLYGPSTVTVQQALQSVFANYNNVQESFVQLVDDTDVDYNDTNAFQKTIRIEFRNPSSLGAGGEARPIMSGSRVIGCNIVLKKSLIDKAKAFIKTVTHEIGHCPGLDHSQDTIAAVMSYFSETDLYRLGVDDKMGLIYLYPTYPDRAAETSTLGLSCSRR